MPHEQGAWALRFVPNGAVCVCDGGRPTSRGLSPAGRQCRQPEPSAPCRRAHAPRAGGMGASFRSEWGGLCMRRRQAHEQGPVACGAAVPPARAFGAVQTRPCPTSRGHGRFVSFRMGRFVYATAADPRAGACRLRRFWGGCGRERKWTADMLRRPKRIIPQVPFAVAFSPAAQAGRRPAAVCCLPRAIRDRGHDIHGNRPGILF